MKVSEINPVGHYTSKTTLAPEIPGAPLSLLGDDSHSAESSRLRHNGLRNRKSSQQAEEKLMQLKFKKIMKTDEKVESAISKI